MDGEVQTAASNGELTVTTKGDAEEPEAAKEPEQKRYTQEEEIILNTVSSLKTQSRIHNRGIIIVSEFWLLSIFLL